jgi:hypothetical protein
VRVTAQLINADDGTHIWAEDYDRQLTDIFAIQEDIARAIAASLRMPLGLKPGENLVNNRKIDPASYANYLHGRKLLEGRGAAAMPEVVSLLQGSGNGRYRRDLTFPTVVLHPLAPLCQPIAWPNEGRSGELFWRQGATETETETE